MAMENPFDQKIGYKFTNKISKLTPLQDHVIVTDMSFGSRVLNSGVILLGDDGTTDGIRPRWSKVFAVGPEQTDVKVGQWILVEHGRWTRGVYVEMNGEELSVRRVDVNAILMISEGEPVGVDAVSTAVHGERKEREYYGAE